MTTKLRDGVLYRPSTGQMIREITISETPDIYGTTYYVNANTGDGNDEADGLSWETALLTMARAFALVASGDTIYFKGNVKEQLTTPVNIFDVTVIGAGTNPRHADTSPAGGEVGATWKPPDSAAATTPLVSVIQQGWRFVNVLFDAPADDACIELFRNTGAGDLERDASHAYIAGCKFVGGQEGILNTGGASHVIVEDCRFYDLTDGIKCASTSVAIPLRWVIRDCYFIANTNHIRSSLTQSVISGSTFGKFTTLAIDPSFNSSQGVDNIIFGNYLSGTYAAADYVPGTDNEWGGNFGSLTGGVTADDPA